MNKNHIILAIIIATALLVAYMQWINPEELSINYLQESLSENEVE